MTQSTQWLTIPEFAVELGVEAGDVRDKIREGKIVAVRRGENNTWQLPAGFIIPGAVSPHIIPTLRGTLTLLSDVGLSDEEAMEWLLEPAKELGMSPLDALREGQRAPVRRLAQTLL
ncbi:Rv2175c family DNA-binding protein [Demequina aurantiaca]|uniref:Rv2175c family DNA-binding protein n=1 Tax=Demequina aurantiaca TaxID=676200 RepID=UPI0007837D38|nr:Rv2175c family DNA-binding protein [Demequina aurantiaca]